MPTQLINWDDADPRPIALSDNVSPDSRLPSVLSAGLVLFDGIPIAEWLQLVGSPQALTRSSRRKMEPAMGVQPSQFMPIYRWKS
jgi:hypothetical protein